MNCPTYNLGMYDVCLTCELDCPQNTKSKSSIVEIIGVIGGLLGLDNNKKKELSSTFNNLNKPEFKGIYSSLENASNSIKDVLSGKLGSSDIAKKVLEIETNNLKSEFSKLITNGQISKEEVENLKNNFNSTDNMMKLKSLLEGMKQ